MANTTSSRFRHSSVWGKIFQSYRVRGLYYYVIRVHQTELKKCEKVQIFVLFDVQKEVNKGPECAKMLGLSVIPV